MEFVGTMGCSSLHYSRIPTLLLPSQVSSCFLYPLTSSAYIRIAASVLDGESVGEISLSMEQVGRRLHSVTDRQFTIRTFQHSDLSRKCMEMGTLSNITLLQHMASRVLLPATMVTKTVRTLGANRRSMRCNRLRLCMGTHISRQLGLRQRRPEGLVRRADETCDDCVSRSWAGLVQTYSAEARPKVPCKIEACPRSDMRHELETN